MPKQKLLKELHKPIMIKFEKLKEHSSFIESSWGAYLADMQLISKFNKGFWSLLCDIDFISNIHGLFL